MKNFALLVMIILLTSVRSFSQREQDSLALVALYNSTDGVNWTNHANWLSSKPISAWYGITLSDNRVTEIDLYNNNLSGSIPGQIGNLTNLADLYFGYNKLSGSIPKEIGNLNKLITLSLYMNQLSGSIPKEIGNLTSLQRLFLDRNQLTGSVPVEIGSLTNLIDLVLYNNKLSGSVPAEIGNMTDLKSILLNNNQFTGSVPNSINDLTRLEVLRLHSNSLDELPALSMSLLDELSIQNNKFTFEDIEPNINIPLLTYFPQDSVGDKNSITLNEGEDIIFNVICGGSQNQYQWYKDGILIPAAISSTYSISDLQSTDAGSYYCSVTNTIVPYLKISSRATYLSISGPTDISENEMTGIKVYPNPTEGLLKIELGKDFPGANSIEIYDCYGKRIIQKSLEDLFYHEIDLSCFPNGMYCLKIKNSEYSYSRKIIIH